MDIQPFKPEIKPAPDDISSPEVKGGQPANTNITMGGSMGATAQNQRKSTHQGIAKK